MEIAIENLTADHFKQILKGSIKIEERMELTNFFTGNFGSGYVGEISNNNFYFYFQHDKFESNYKVIISTWRERVVPTCLYGEIVEDDHKLKIFYGIEKHRYYAKFFKKLFRPAIILSVISLLMGGIVIFAIAFDCSFLYVVYLITSSRIDEKRSVDLENKLKQIIDKAVI